MPRCVHGFKGKQCRECFPPDPIVHTNHIRIEGWTWPEFMSYVEYETKFALTCERVLDEDDADATFVLTTRNPHGFRMMPVHTTTTIALYKARGEVPSFDD